MKEIVIYGKENCPFCVKAKDIPYPDDYVLIYKDIEHDPQLKKELLILYPFAKTVPQIWVDGEHIGGYDHYKEYAILNF